MHFVFKFWISCHASPKSSRRNFEIIDQVFLRLHPKGGRNYIEKITETSVFSYQISNQSILSVVMQIEILR